MKTQLNGGPNNFGGVNTNYDVDEVKNNGDGDDADGGKGISRIFFGHTILCWSQEGVGKELVR